MFMIVSRCLCLRTRNITYKDTEKIKTHILVSLYFFSDNRAFYDIMWTSMVEANRQIVTM